MNKQINQYIVEYEELEELDSNKNDLNTNSELIKKIKALMIEFLFELTC
jgi:hypothetical protein